MAVTSRQLAAFVYKQENLDRLVRDKELYDIWNGKIRETIKTAIIKEFKKPETVKELCKRVTPINLTQKIVNKLGGIYKNPPKRTANPEDNNDEEVITRVVDILDLNNKFKIYNKLVKLNKRGALEPYVSDGKPKLRVLPAYTFTQYSDSALDPDEPTHTIKHINMEGADRALHLHIVWSADRHYLMNGYGNIIDDYGNDYGINPIVYTKESIDLTPIQDDDLYFLQIAICLLLTDLSFAAKYQSWSVVAVIGAETKSLSFNPNSIINVPNAKDGTQGDIKTIQPKVDTEGVLRIVEALVGLLLTTKNLSIGSVSIKLEATDAASGVAKILDQSESTEDKEDQRALYVTAEKQLFHNLKVMLPVWNEADVLDVQYKDLEFSDEFEVSVNFYDQKPVTSEKEIVETEVLKLENSLSTLEDSLSKLYPSKSPEEIKSYMEKILLERQKKIENDKENSNASGQSENADKSTSSSEGGVSGK